MKRSSTARLSISERSEESPGVHQHDGIEVQPETLERDSLEQLLERAGAAGKCDRRLAERQHHVLAGAQVLDQLQARQSLVPPLELGHESRQDADHPAAVTERAVCERAHGADRAAPVHNPDSLSGEHLAQAPRCGPILRVREAAGGAVHADGGLDGTLGR